MTERTRSDERVIQRVSADDLEKIRDETGDQSLALGRMIGLAFSVLNQVIDQVNELTVAVAATTKERAPE